MFAVILYFWWMLKITFLKYQQDKISNLNKSNVKLSKCFTIKKWKNIYETCNNLFIKKKINNNNINQSKMVKILYELYVLRYFF